MDLKQMNKINRLKLAKMLLQFGYLKTDKGVLSYEGELAEGIEVFLEEGDELVTAPDGTYITDDVIVEVADGKIIKIETKEIVEEIIEESKDEPKQEEEKLAEEEVVKEKVAQEEPAEPEKDEKDVRIEELEAEVESLNATIEAKDAEIDSLKAQLQETTETPVEEIIEENKTFSKEERRMENLSKALKRN